MAISGPKIDGEYPDRLVGCEQAIEAELQALIARAMDAGWDEMEACSAISSLVDHHLLSMLANAETDRRISAADSSGIFLRAQR